MHAARDAFNHADQDRVASEKTLADARTALQTATAALTAAKKDHAQASAAKAGADKALAEKKAQARRRTRQGSGDQNRDRCAGGRKETVRRQGGRAGVRRTSGKLTHGSDVLSCPLARDQCWRQEQIADDRARRDVCRGRVQGSPDLYSERERHFQCVAERVFARLGPDHGTDRQAVGVSHARHSENRRQLQDVLAGNPFLTPGVDEKALYVMFLANSPAPADVAKLDPDRSPGDAFIVRGQSVYMHLPNNVAAQQAHQCLLRLEARDHQYQPELADGHEAAGVDGRGSVAFSRKLRELRIRLIE